MEKKPNEERSLYRDGFNMVSTNEQEMMGEITGKKFNHFPGMIASNKGLPRLGFSDEEKQISLGNAKLILENSDFFEEYCERTKKDKENAEYALRAIISAFGTRN
jgi:hypothetical protein